MLWLARPPFLSPAFWRGFFYRVAVSPDSSKHKLSGINQNVAFDIDLDEATSRRSVSSRGHKSADRTWIAMPSSSAVCRTQEAGGDLIRGIG